MPHKFCLHNNMDKESEESVMVAGDTGKVAWCMDCESYVYTETTNSRIMVESEWNKRVYLGQVKRTKWNRFKYDCEMRWKNILDAVSFAVRKVK